jgi:tripartite ATP-independent transporter DctP family solute receptor
MSNARATTWVGPSRRAVLIGGAGIAAGFAAPAIAQTAPKRVVVASVAPPYEASSVAFIWMAKEINEKSKGSIDFEFHPGTLINKEIEIINAVKTGSIAAGTPSGASATTFPEINVLLSPYLVRDYAHAYRVLNGPIGDAIDAQIQSKYQCKVLLYFDLGFRHFWNNKRPINEPNDLRGLRIRVQQAKVFADTVSGLGANAVPIAWNELYAAVQQGVVDGGDLPIVNQLLLKTYEVAKYSSLTYHNYSPTMLVMNLGVWNGFSKEQQEIIREAARGAQQRVREATESVDSLAKAKELLEPKGMIVNGAQLDPFRKLAQEKIWPAYQKLYPDLWDKIVKTAEA